MEECSSVEKCLDSHSIKKTNGGSMLNVNVKKENCIIILFTVNGDL